MAETRVLAGDARGALTLDTHLFSPLSWRGADMQYARYSALVNMPAYEALDVLEQVNHDAQRIRDSRWVTYDMENDGRYLTTQGHVYDLDGQLLEQLEVLPTALLRQFVTLDGEPLALIAGTGAIHYFHNDHLGTPQVLTNGSGAVTWQARYDAFGKATLLVNAVEQPLRFPGQVVDRHVPELHYNWHRYYDTTTGRYVSSDPIGLRGGWNTFVYALSIPTRLRDPSGLDIAIIENGRTSGRRDGGSTFNPAGHTAAAVTGRGVVSFGNGTARGSSLADYLAREAPYRNTTVWVIPATPAQDAAFWDAMGRYGDMSLPGDPWAPVYDNCSTRVHDALDAAGIGCGCEFIPETGGYNSPPPFLPGSAGYRASRNGATRYTHPRRATSPPPGLQQFEPN